ncbi:hypothetical protein ACIPEQ_03935 [Curtobacterium sp. NPDC087080]|uniref:hypothetical protein n=1 Tax=Curtobacterium sp. NPDC087080 TaxID=3363965 RepID=UPI00381F9783
MRQCGFRWFQATVWTIERAERPLRVGEAQVAAQAMGRPFFNFAADDGAADIEAAMRECSQAAQVIDAALTRFEEARFDLAFQEKKLPEEVTNRHHNVGGWLSTSVEDLVQQHREHRREDGSPLGRLAAADGEWLQEYNATIAKEYADGEHSAAQ